MRRSKTYILVAVLLVAVIALAGVAAACGGDDTEASPSPEATSAADIANMILGKAPSGLAATIVDRGSVIVANDANYPPQSSVDQATGELVGFDVDVALKMGEILGLEVQFENPAWETIPTGLNQSKYDVSIGSMTITPERDKELDFTEPYYYTSGQMFVKKGGQQIAGVDDLNGKKIGVGAATTYYDFLKANSKADVKTYTTDADTFPDLRNGNLDFVMTAGPTGQQAISQGQPFDFSGAPLYYEDLAFAIKQGEGDWLAMLNYAVNMMHQDGSLTAMSETWYNGLDLTVKE
ncbi:MAG TPA: transporter substrate-binding domain-containing protein [Thermoleophilia bacterium]|nr:transporter substrate-binding domain-containing protein [Thermoleophilia bacterium]